MTRARRPFAVWPWLVLVAATIAAWLVTENAADGRLATTLVIVIASIKIRMIVIYFMEVPWTARRWRLALELWIGGACLIVLGGYWFTYI
jgi:caa(3)-type oxidase subunit IV